MGTLNFEYSFGMQSIFGTPFYSRISWFMAYRQTWFFWTKVFQLILMLFAIICCSISIVQTEIYSNIIYVVCSEIVMIIVVSIFIVENDRNNHIVDQYFEMVSSYIMFVINGYLGFQITLERSTTLEFYAALLFYALMTVFYADARRLQISRLKNRAQKHD